MLGLVRLRIILKTIYSELLVVYCFTFERFLHDPEDLIEESSSLLLETSSAFTTEPLPQDRDEIFWKSFDKMRIIAEDDIVALDGFSMAAQLCQKQIKIRYGLRSVCRRIHCSHWLKECFSDRLGPSMRIPEILNLSDGF